ncbi:hypothetical protein WJX75_007240 [Coccomyxa subellipsoidea]|uniref:non-specific serine/threonine protein kinase n=1 Tax=Coccomyxa subellipsoidea TaxID=248742 RepID=A0ABR2YYC4_9CHLO
MAAHAATLPDADAIRSLTIDEDRYERLECIGRGSFGDVYKGLDKESDMEVAIKVIDLEDVEDDIEDIHKEVAVLAKCRSVNITEYYASVLKPGSSELFIVMELMAASVADLLDEQPLEEPEIAHVLRQVLKALMYLHGEHRVHRDIKAANVLLSAEGAVKISDFGVSGQLTGTLGYRRRTFVGTPYWMAPEVIETSEEGYSQTADIWSLGITAIEMATGTPPLAELHPMRALFLIPKNAAPQLQGPYSPALRNFVGRCLHKDPMQRPSALELLEDDFVREAQLSESLKHRISEHLAHHKPVTASKRSGMAEMQLTLPKWDFSRSEQRGGTIKAGRHMRTLKSHQISALTLRDGATLGTLPRDRSRLQHMGATRAVDPISESAPSTAEQEPQHSAHAGALKALMEQALAASGASKEEATQCASALSAIASLDKQRPGTLQRMLEQMGRSHGEQPADLGSQHERAGSYLGRVVPAVSEDVHQEPRAEVALDLGPLGNFLLARWRESIEQDIDASSAWSDSTYV